MFRLNVFIKKYPKVYTKSFKNSKIILFDMINEQKPWYKRTWVIVIGVILILAIIGSFLPKTETTTQEKSVSDYEYKLLINGVEKIITDTATNALSTLNKFSNEQITSSQASELYKQYKINFENAKTKLNSKKAPEKFNGVYSHYNAALDLYIEAMNLASQAFEQNNFNLLTDSSNKLTEGNTEVNTGRELLKAIN